MGIKLSKRKLKKGRFSLYLDCNLEGKRFKESLGITLEPPTCKEARQANCVKWQLAKLLRARREIDYLHTHYWSKLPPLFQVSNAQRHSDEETETLANPNEPIDLQEPDSLDFFLVAASYQNISSERFPDGASGFCLSETISCFTFTDKRHYTQFLYRFLLLLAR